MVKRNRVIFFVLSVIILLVVLGRTIFALCLPLETFHRIVVPKGQIVSSEDLFDRPTYLEDHMEWFPGCLTRWQIRQLARHMKKNGICIVSGEYEFYSTYYGEKLFESFDYADVSDIG